MMKRLVDLVPLVTLIFVAGLLMLVIERAPVEIEHRQATVVPLIGDPPPDACVIADRADGPGPARARPRPSIPQTAGCRDSSEPHGMVWMAEC